MPPGERDDHDPLAVGGREVTGEPAVQVIADPGTIGLADLCLGQEAQVPGDGECHVGESQRDPAALPGSVPAALGGQQPDSGVQAAGHIPGRQYVIHRPAQLGGPGDHGEAGGRIDGVVDGGTPVMVTLDQQVDQVRTVCGQLPRSRASPARPRWSARSRRQDRTGPRDPRAGVGPRDPGNRA